MVQIQIHDEPTLTTEKTAPDFSSIKFFTIYAFICIGFGCAIPLFNLMFHFIFSALAGLIFIFIGSGCALFAAAKFLQQLDE